MAFHLYLRRSPAIRVRCGRHRTQREREKEREKSPFPSVPCNFTTNGINYENAQQSIIDGEFTICVFFFFHVEPKSCHVLRPGHREGYKYIIELIKPLESSTELFYFPVVINNKYVKKVINAYVIRKRV